MKNYLNMIGDLHVKLRQLVDIIKINCAGLEDLVKEQIFKCNTEIK